MSIREDINTIYENTAVPWYNVPKTIKKLHRGEETRVVLTGTSITADSSPGDPSLSWQSLVKLKLIELYPNNSIFWQNSGVGGSTSTYLRENWDALVTPYKPTLIIIDHGTNDMNIPNAERLANYAFFKEKAEELGAEVLLITNATVYFTPAPYGNTPDLNVAKREEIAQQTRDIAKKYRWGLCDVNEAWRRWLTDHNLTVETTLLHYDHIHLNDLGHRIYASEVMMAFEINSFRDLDTRYGGEGFTEFGNITLRDFVQERSRAKQWDIFDLENQLVSWGGLWWTRDYRTRQFKKAKLHGTQVVNGDETMQGRFQKFWHIRAKEPDYIELEVTDPKRVWLGLSSDSATVTDFVVKINDAIVQTISVTSTSNPFIEINFNSSGLKYFRKGKQRIKLERKTELPPLGTIEFHGFLVKYYKEDEPEIFANPTSGLQKVNQSFTYEDLDVAFSNMQVASNIGLRAPMGLTDYNGGFIQGVTRQPTVLLQKGYGDNLTLRFRSTITNNYIGIYIDGVLKEIYSARDSEAGTLLSKKFTGLGIGKEHELELISLTGEINLQSILWSDTL